MTQRERQILSLIEANPMISQQELADALQITRSSVAVHISNLLKKGYIAGKGYVLRHGTYAVVVGGVNVDIGGRSAGALVQADSNPGTVTVSLGGVGRNIAHNLSLMGADVRMLTAFGQDLYGQKVASSCAELGIDVSHALRCSDAATSTYLYIADPQGEMAVAISDMSICDRITPAYLAQNCHAPLFVDPVSTAKAPKLLPILSRIHTLKPNRLEAELLSGVKIVSAADAEAAARALLEKGVHRVFISMGAEGVYAADENAQLWLQNLPGKMVNTTGCGDAFMAALVWAYLEDADLQETALAGLAAGAIAMEYDATINPAMSADALRARMKK